MRGMDRVSGTDRVVTSRIIWLHFCTMAGSAVVSSMFSTDIGTDWFLEPLVVIRGTAGFGFIFQRFYNYCVIWIKTSVNVIQTEPTANHRHDEEELTVCCVCLQISQNYVWKILFIVQFLMDEASLTRGCDLSRQPMKSTCLMLETSNSLACAHDAVWLVTELLFVVPGVTWNLLRTCYSWVFIHLHCY